MIACAPPEQMHSRVPIPAQIPFGPQATWPCGSGGVRAAVASWPPREDFYCGCPLLAVIGRAVVIAEALSECGCPGCVADVVAVQWARPQGERGTIGRFAVGLLARTGRRP